MEAVLIEEQVKLFVAQQTEFKIDKISLSTELGKDLGIDGDDAVELLENFSEKFQVDLSTFEFDKYFGMESGLNPVMWLISMLFGSSVYNLEPLTIQDLVDSAKAKRWLKN